MMGALVASVVTLPFSIKLCHGAIIILIVNWLCEGEWAAKLSTLNQSVLLKLIVLFFILQIFGLAFSDNIARGWSAVEKKIFLFLLPVALATSSVKLARKELDFVFAVFLATCFAGTAICLFKAWNELQLTGASAHAVPDYLSQGEHAVPAGSAYWLKFSYISLASGIGMHPTYLSLYIAVCVLLVLDRIPSIGNSLVKAIAVALILYLTAFVMLLSSRIVIIGLGVVFAFIFIRSIARKRTFAGLLATGSAVILVLMLFVNPVARHRSLEINGQTFDIQPGTEYATAAQIRVSLWWIALRSLENTNPLTGKGTGDVAKTMATTAAAFDITNIIRSFDPHNQYLYTCLANGLPALLALLLCLFLPAWWSWMHGDYLSTGFVFLIALVCVTESVFELQKGIVLYSLASGLLFFHKHSFQNIGISLSSFPRTREEIL